MPETKPVQSLMRGIELIRLLAAEAQGMRLQDLAHIVGLKTPTVHNLLKTLVLAGLVEKLPNNNYGATLSLSQLGDSVRFNRRHACIENLLREISQKHQGLTLNFSQPLQAQIAVILRMSPDQPLILQYPRGRQNPLYSSATGLAFQSFASEEDVSSMREFQPFQDSGIRHWQSRAALEEHLEQQREQGFAKTEFAQQELFRLAFPIYDNDKELTGFLGIAAPTTRISDEVKERKIIESMQGFIHNLNTELFSPND